MPIDQVGLNTLLSVFRPKNYLETLREKREGIWKKLSSNVRDDSKDNKQVIADLQATDKQIQQEIYEEKSRKLELERLKREEAAAKNLRERERVYAAHERVLQTASINKLFSATCNAAEYRAMAKGGTPLLFNNGVYEKDGYTSNRLLEKTQEISGNIKESVEYGVAAAEVARRRKDNRIKLEIEVALTNEAARKKKRKRSINIII